jgi:hypothetical protein
MEAASAHLSNRLRISDKGDYGTGFEVFGKSLHGLMERCAAYSVKQNPEQAPTG